MQQNAASRRTCPYCGAPLHEQAVFCPHCARSINARKVPVPPRPLPRKLLYTAAVLCALAVLALVIWHNTRPKVYDGMGEVIYRSGGEDYQLCIAWADAPFTPCYDRYSDAELNFDYRYPVLLYANHVVSDTHAAETFMQKVDSVTASFAPTDPALTISCTPPAPDTSYIPDAASITFVDFNISAPGTYTADLVVTVTMKNGDVIRVHQNHHFETIATYNYTPEDVPMGTTEELQTLADQIDQTTEEGSVVNIYLPPVTYEGSLVLDIRQRGINLYGSKEGRTTFTGSIRMTSHNMWISEFTDIDFTGSGSGIGISAANRIHLIDCNVTGWETGLLCYGDAWAWMRDCRFEDNGIGFHFNCTGAGVSNYHYTGNTFANNGTGILMEQVPTDIPLDFAETLFTGNGTDIDNRCNHPLELSEAIFQ